MSSAHILVSLNFPVKKNKISNVHEILWFFTAYQYLLKANFDQMYLKPHSKN